jgi:hypothetical protein
MPTAARMIGPMPTSVSMLSAMLMDWMCGRPWMLSASSRPIWSPMPWCCRFRALDMFLRNTRLARGFSPSRMQPARYFVRGDVIGTTTWL